MSERYICWHCDQSWALIPRLWREWFSSEGSRVFNAKEAAESKAMNMTQLRLSASARCLVLNQISKHNMRSYNNVLIPVGELCCCSGKSDGIQLEEQDYQHIHTKTTSINIINSSKMKWNRTQAVVAIKITILYFQPSLKNNHNRHFCYSACVVAICLFNIKEHVQH